MQSMESPKKKSKEDGRKTLKHFMKKELIHPPNKTLRVWIVSKPQSDSEEDISIEESPPPEVEGSDDDEDNEEIVDVCGFYISRQSSGLDFSFEDGSVEEYVDVNSELLSSRSCVFRELFSGMELEAREGPVTIQIEASEENAFVGLLDFIYFSNMPPPSYEEIVDLLMISDEFRVISCADECIRQLVYKLNSVFSCFELSYKVHWLTVRESLAKKAMDYVADTILDNRKWSPTEKDDSNIMRKENELLRIPFSGIKAVFCMDSLEIESEDVVYDFILYWARIKYPKTEDDCTAEELHLERLIRFTYLTHQKLEEALKCDFFYPESASKAVVEALAFKVREPYCRGVTPQRRSNKQFLERRYKSTPIRVTRLRFPEFDRCQVFFSLTEDELLKMFYWHGRRESEDFQFGHQRFSLVASWKEVRKETCFELSITAKAEILDRAVYATRILAMREGDDGPEFSEIGRGTLIPANQDNAGSYHLLPEFWSELLSSTCRYIIGRIFHLCVEITCKRQDSSYAC